MFWIFFQILDDSFTQTALLSIGKIAELNLLRIKNHLLAPFVSEKCIVAAGAQKPILVEVFKKKHGLKIKNIPMKSIYKYKRINTYKIRE